MVGIEVLVHMAFVSFSGFIAVITQADIPYSTHKCLWHRLSIIGMALFALFYFGSRNTVLFHENV